MDNIKIVSFDVEGTLVTTDFSYAIWFEAIPQRYAECNDISFEEAGEIVEGEYQKMGDQRMEWYDIRYWFSRLGLGLPSQVMERCQDKVNCYPEVKEVLTSLEGRYKLTVASGAPREFLNHLLRDIEPYFDKVFSSVSHYKQLKTTEFYRKMCQELGVLPEQVVHIGDNWQFDFIAPTEVGIHAFYLDREGNSNHRDPLTSLTQLEVYLTS